MLKKYPTTASIITILGGIIISLFLTNHLISGATIPSSPEIWQIRSIDTMKTSRDKAREELHNPSYDIEIQKELTAVKNTGANYVAIDTPYDAEFLPYLTRWVTFARKTGLHVWFRGNWSSWEGWFDYPKNMTPEEHIAKNETFIQSHSDLFQDGDIFDPCPECENAGFWPQPDKNQAYNMFIQEQSITTKAAFAKIGKQVYTNIESVIGGRAKDVFNQKTVAVLGNVVSIDHYFANPQSMSDYLDYFTSTFQAKVVVSEFGAPIPDINGSMTQQQQADFINQVYHILYLQNHDVLGVNYYVITGGSTPLLNDDGSERLAYNSVRNYFTPAVITGRITTPLGDPIAGTVIHTSDGATHVQSNKNGDYALAFPPGKISLAFTTTKYKSVILKATASESGKILTYNEQMEPLHPDLWYRIRLFIRNSKLSSLLSSIFR